MVITIAPPTLATLPISYVYRPYLPRYSASGHYMDESTASRLTTAGAAYSQMSGTIDTSRHYCPTNNSALSSAQNSNPPSASAIAGPDLSDRYRSPRAHTMSAVQPAATALSITQTASAPLEPACELSQPITDHFSQGHRPPSASLSPAPDIREVPPPGPHRNDQAQPAVGYTDYPRQSARLRMKREHDTERDRIGNAPDTPITVGGSDDESGVPLAGSRQKRAKHNMQQKGRRAPVRSEKEGKDVILVSADDKEYRVSSAVLIASCSLFSDAMHGLRRSLSPTLERSQHVKESPATIDIPHSGKALDLAIKLLHNQNFPCKLPFTQMQELLDLGSFLGSQIITDRLVAQLHVEIRSSPWAVFLMAAQLLDLPLARNALGQMYRHDNKKYRNMAAEDVMSDIGEPLSKRWALALYGALSSHPYTKEGKGVVRDKACLRWTAISDAFDPYKSTK